MLQSGQGVIVSNRLIMTALHNASNENEYEITMHDGSVKRAKVHRQWYEDGKVDIALLILQDKYDSFESFLPILKRPVQPQERIMCVSRQPSLGGDTDVLTYPTSTVNGIEPDGMLFRAQYYAIDEISGAAVITSIQRDGSVYVIGVHVAPHDWNIAPPPIKKRKGGVADAESVSLTPSSLSKSIHGHSAYCLVCIASSVNELMEIASADLHSNLT
jgi:hypothetical protein